MRDEEDASQLDEVEGADLVLVVGAPQDADPGAVTVDQLEEALARLDSSGGRRLLVFSVRAGRLGLDIFPLEVTRNDDDDGPVAHRLGVWIGRDRELNGR